MTGFFECTAVDENGTGLTFPANVRAKDVQAIIEVPGVVKGAVTMLTIRGQVKHLLVAERRDQIMQRIRHS